MFLPVTEDGIGEEAEADIYGEVNCELRGAC